MTDYRELDIQVVMPYFVVERKPDPMWTYSGRTDSDKCIIGYAKSGKAFYSSDGKSFKVGKGDIVLFTMGKEHSAYSNPEDPWSFYSVCFTPEFGDAKSREIFCGLPSVLRCSDSQRMAANFAELSRVWSTRERGYRLKCRSLILDILFMMLSDEDRRRFSSAHYERISSVIDMMRVQFDKSWSVAELSHLSGLSESHFRMLFKQMTGYTTVQFQNHMKIDKAKDLLLSKSCNVSEAARAVGYSDVYYFSRLFRKLTGWNPSEFL